MSRPHLGCAVAALVCMAAYGLSTAAYAWLAGPALSLAARRLAVPLGMTFTAPRWMLTPTAVVVAIAAIAVLRAAARLGQELSVGRFEQRVLFDTQQKLAIRLRDLPYRELLRRGSDDLGLRLSEDVAKLRVFIGYGVAQLAHQALTSAALLSLAWRFDPLLTLIGAAVLPPIAWLLMRRSRHAQAAQRQVWDVQHRLSGDLLRLARATPMLRSYGRQAWVSDRLQQHNVDYAAAVWRHHRLRSVTTPLVELLGATALILALLLTSWRVAHHQLGLESYASLLAILVMLYRPLQAAGSVAFSLSSGAAALQRLEELLTLPSETVTPASAAVASPLALELPPMQQQLVVDDLHFAYDQRPILRGVSFELRAGEKVALVGGSGAGKTTLLLLLLGLLKPSRGRLCIDAIEISTASQRSVAAQFAWVAQTPMLLPGSLAFNVTLEASGDVDAADQRRLQQAARDSGLQPLVERLPDGWMSEALQGDVGFSVGEQQRICLARALFHDAPILLLDEPTAALDPASEQALGHTLERLVHSPATRYKHTVLYASHRPSTVAQADRVLVLQDGRIVEQGPPATLWQQRGAYYQLFRDSLTERA